jgi:uncharacterized protein GlcG (DUF336 family)
MDHLQLHQTPFLGVHETGSRPAGGIPLRAVNGDLLGAIGVSGARSNKTSRLRAPA